MDQWSSCTLLVRIQSGKTTLGNNLTLPGKVRNLYILLHSNATPAGILITFLHRCTWKYSEEWS